MAEASKLLLKFSKRLFQDSETQGKFVDALIHPRSFNPCILWTKPKPEQLPFEVEPPTSWQPNFCDRLPLLTRPGQYALHQEGYYYCLDFSSVFAASALFAIAHPVHTVMDVCASPGGKSLFAWKALHPSRLFSNEVIGKRIGALVSNLRRCTGNIDDTCIKSVLNLDSQMLADLIPQTIDLAIVDAPCSGQSLLAKGDSSPGCFHPVSINKNANRQKRILANSAQLVSPQGYLAYMTCAYSPEENEQVGEWLLSKFPQFKPLPVAHLANYQSHLTDLPSYRMFPHNSPGAGAFVMLFQNTDIGTGNPLPEDFLNHPKVITILDQ